MRVAVVGATGAVGSTMLEVLRERSFPADEVVPFASERSAGRSIDWGDASLTVQPLDDESIQGFEIALFSAGSAVSAEWAPRFADAGAVVVDNSSQWRMNEDVPLVVSEVNPEALDGHKGIVANPNCTTMQTVVALAPILKRAGIERIVMSSYQAVSGTGQKAVDELYSQAEGLPRTQLLERFKANPRGVLLGVDRGRPNSDSESLSRWRRAPGSRLRGRWAGPCGVVDRRARLRKCVARCRAPAGHRLRARFRWCRA